MVVISHRMTNKNNNADINHTIQYTRWLLKSLGIWPIVIKNPKYTEIFFSKILMAFCLLLMAFNMVPSTIHVIYREKNVLMRIMLFGPIIYWFTNFLKYCSMIFRYDSIKLCLEQVEADWTIIYKENDRNIMRKNVNVGRGFTAICGLFIFSGGISYNTIMPLLHGNRVDELNQTIRPLVWPGYDIFVNPQSSPTYEIIFYTNSLSACLICTITTATCNIAAIFVTHSCGQIDIMISRLNTLFVDIHENDVLDDVLKDRVGFVIRCHVKILRFTSNIERVLREICFVDVVSSTLSICVLAYYCMTEWNKSEPVAILTYFMLLISLSLNIFIFCHIGEMLKEQCYQIGKATYMIDWYKLPAKTSLALVMIIAMSNCPRKITAGGMIELSITSFGVIIKTSVAYLNMLRTITI